MWYNTYLAFDFLILLKSLTISYFSLQKLKHWQHWLETNSLQNARWIFPEKRGAPCPLSQLFLGRRRITCPVLLLSATEKTRILTRRYTVFVIDFMKFIDYICFSEVTVKHKWLVKYRRNHFNKFSYFTFLSGEAAWLRGKLRPTNLIKINTHGIASYYFRRSLWGIIMQTDSFQKFSDLTLKATFIIFLEKNSRPIWSSVSTNVELHSL